MTLDENEGTVKQPAGDRKADEDLHQEDEVTAKVEEAVEKVTETTRDSIGKKS